jgi:hypothetical protein
MLPCEHEQLCLSPIQLELFPSSLRQPQTVEEVALELTQDAEAEQVALEGEEAAVVLCNLVLLQMDHTPLLRQLRKDRTRQRSEAQEAAGSVEVP